MMFKDVIGQEKVKARLVQTVEDGRISHAQLFLGPEGSGNLPMAIAYAQYICCENKHNSDSCGKCSSCIKYEKLIHPDLHFIYPVSSTKEVQKPQSTDFLPVWREAFFENPYMTLNDWYERLGIENKQGYINAEDCNAITRRLSLMAYESEYKIMIIWQPERLYHAAAPKLLKILEEPPEKTLFILVAQNTEDIIKTILSRTHLVKLAGISDEHIEEALIERFAIEKEQASQIVYLAEGSYSRALKLADKNEEESDNIRKFRDWMRLCFKKDVVNLIEWTEEVSKTGRERQKGFLSYSLYMIRECLVFNYQVNELIRINREQYDFISKFSCFVNNANCEEMTEMLNEASRSIERNANPKILFFDTSLRFCELLQRKPKAPSVLC